MAKSEPLSKTYDPKQVEPQIYAFWERGDYFHPDPDDRPPEQRYVIMIPLPNVTGALHLGHALNTLCQDVMIRWHRMQGHNTLWMPGTDHAGIATQSVVERRIFEEEGKTRHDLGRDELVRRIWAWKDEYQRRILSQLKLMGCSCDWKRTRFTLDEVCSRAVRHTFWRLFRDGLIYRGLRLVNWDTQLQTAVADDEVYHETVQGHMWHVRYPLADGNGYLTVATTRPETMLGDTAVAVHPDDKRYQHLIGKTCILPLMNRKIPIIADPILVNMEFGSGCVKVTPGHDPNDYDCGRRHNLEMINILTPDGRINENGGRFAGMDRYAARKEVVAALEAEGLIEKVEDYEHEVGHSDRSKTPIEPYLSLQWFVRMGDVEGGVRLADGSTTTGLAQAAIDAVLDGRVKVFPERYAKTYLDWLSEKRDWCISRQLWWGHRIPVWYCEDCEIQAGNMLKAGQQGQQPSESTPWTYHILEGATPILGPNPDEAPQTCPACGGRNLVQDPDVLDTWFSSALWPHSTLHWPENHPDLAFYYPGSVLITSRDIITLWVARMVLMGLYNVGQVPFRHVYIHPKILDGEGQTMSKSKGNGVDPIDVIKMYGADAMRFSLASMNTQTQDLRMPVSYCCPHCNHLTPQTRELRSRRTLTCPACRRDFQLPSPDFAPQPDPPMATLASEKFEIGRNFCNKLWNAARFAFMSLEGTRRQRLSLEALPLEDRWILSQLAKTIAHLHEYLNGYHYSRAVECLRDFFWDSLCDWYLELIKSRIRQGEQDAEARQVLAFCLDQTLRMLHPFVPFITERLWHQLNELVPERGLPGLAELNVTEALTIAPFPPAEGYPALRDEAVEAVFADLQQATRGVRDVRSARNVAPRRLVDVVIKVSADRADSLQHQAHIIRKLAGVGRLTIDPQAVRPRNAATIVAGDLQIFVADVIDDEAERRRLGRELAELDKQIAAKERKLANEQFVARAPQEVVARERERLEEFRARRARLQASIEALN